MKHGRFLPAFLGAALCVSAAAFAQLPTTQLTSVFPAGGQQGKTVDVTIAGAELDDCTQLLFSHRGITASAKMTPATALEPARPIANQFQVAVGAEVPPGVYEVRAQGRFGKVAVAQMLTGSNSARMKRVGLARLSTFGILAPFKHPEVVQLLNALTEAGYIESQDVDRFRPIIKLSA